MLTAAGAAYLAAEEAAARAPNINTVKFANVQFVLALNNGAAVVNVGGGVVGLPCTKHGIRYGSAITIAGTTNYNGAATVLASSTADRIDITRAYTAEVLGGAATATVDAATPPSPRDTLTDIQGAAVHTTAPSAAGYDPADPARVIRAVRLDSSVGDFAYTQVGYFSSTGVLVTLYNLPPVYKKKTDVGQTGNSTTHADSRQYSGSNEIAAITVPAATWMYDVNAELMRRPSYAVRIGSAAEKTAGLATHTIADLIASPGTVLPAGTRASIRPGTHTLTANLELANADLVIEAESGAAILALGAYTLTLSGARARANLRATRTTGGIVVSGQGSRLTLADFPIAAITASNGAFVSAGGPEGGTLQRGPARVATPLLRLPLKNSLDALIGKGVLQFTRSGNATYFDNYGNFKIAGTDEARFSGDRLWIESVAATNLFLNSEDMSAGNWNPTRVSLSKPGLKVLGSTYDWIKITEDGTAGADHKIFQGVTLTLGQNYTPQILVKKGSANRHLVFQMNWAGLARISFNLDTGIATVLSGSITARAKKVEADAWLISFSGIPDTTGVGTCTLSLADAAMAVIYNGDGASFIYAAFPQIANLPFPTSPILTAGTTVTRNADSLTLLDPFGNAVRSDMPMAMFATVELFGVHPTLTQEAIAFTGEAPNRRILAAAGIAGMNGYAEMPSAATPVAAARAANAPYRLGWRFDGTKLSYWEKGIKLGEVTPATPLSTAPPTAITIAANMCGLISDVDINGFGPSDYEMSIL